MSELSDLPRECNDNGYGGVCTSCHQLHTVTIYPACVFCLRADVPGHRCSEADVAEVKAWRQARTGHVDIADIIGRLQP